MVRTQIQLPDPLYREVKRIAQEQDWSIAEVIRRGAEAVTRSYPPMKTSAVRNPAWVFPPPIQSRLRVSDPDALKAAIQGESEPRLS